MYVLIAIIFCGLAAGQTGPYYGNPEEVMFPGPVETRNVPRAALRACTNCQSVLSRSLALARQINSLNSADEFLNFVTGVPETAKEPFLTSRIGFGERSMALKPRPAACIPELQPVPFVDDESHASLIYFPTCTRIKRCGGCCGHSLLSCQPVASEPRNFEVIVTKLTPDGEVIYKDKQIMPLDEHTACECKCTTKPEHCSDRQKYIEDECKCACSNIDEEEKCKRNNDTKLWDPVLCSCLCRQELPCSSGFYFDQTICSCRRITSRQWYGNAKETDYTSRQPTKEWDNPIIVPVDASDPRRRHKDEP